MQGVDIPVPKGLYHVSNNRDEIDDGYFELVLGLVGKINAASFGDDAAGTLLFLGMVASRRGLGPWKCRYSFGFSPNVSKTITTFTGDQTFDKAGWQYLWLREKKKDDGTGNRVVIGRLRRG